MLPTQSSEGASNYGSAHRYWVNTESIYLRKNQAQKLYAFTFHDFQGSSVSNMLEPFRKKALQSIIFATVVCFIQVWETFIQVEKKKIS